MILVFKKRMHQLVQVLTRYHHWCQKQDEWIIFIAILIDKHEISLLLALANRLGKKITLLILLRHSEQKKTALPSRPV